MLWVLLVWDVLLTVLMFLWLLMYLGYCVTTDARLDRLEVLVNATDWDKVAEAAIASQERHDA